MDVCIKILKGEIQSNPGITNSALFHVSDLFDSIWKKINKSLRTEKT